MFCPVSVLKQLGILSVAANRCSTVMIAVFLLTFSRRAWIFVALMTSDSTRTQQ